MTKYGTKSNKWSYRDTDSLYFYFNLIYCCLFLCKLFNRIFVVLPFFSLTLALTFSIEALSSVLAACNFLDGLLVLAPATTAFNSALQFSQYSFFKGISDKNGFLFYGFICNHLISAVADTIYFLFHGLILSQTCHITFAPSLQVKH